MSATTVDKGLQRCRAAAIRAAWRQWSVLGGRVGGHYAPPSAVVDPEALLLLSCALRDQEPRLWDIAGGFASHWCGLLSVQRTRNIAAMFPESTSELLAELASIALTEGKDARWRPLAARGHRPFREGKVSSPARTVTDPAALVPRLRLAFGVHARTDALAFLLATSPEAATAKQVADATGYGEMPVRRGLDAIAKSRLIVADGGRPERFRAEGARWGPLLTQRDGFAPWRHWPALFAFLAAALPAPSNTVGTPSDYLASSHARQLVLKHRNAFMRNRIPVPEPADFPGAEFLIGYRDTLVAIANWLDANA